MKRHINKRKLIIFLIAIVSIFVIAGVIFISFKSKGKTDNSSLNDSLNTSSEAETSSSTIDLSSNDSIIEKDSSSIPENSSIPESPEDNEVMAYSNLSYFKKENIEKYKNYKKLNSNLTYQQVILNVNIGLDNAFYSNTHQAENYDSITVLVNKYSYLPSDYVPKDLVTISPEYSTRSVQLRAEAASAFEKMAADAKSKGYTIRAHSTYRSYDSQKSIYNSYVQTDGVVKADTYSARPGFSEHQTGLAADIVAAQSTDITAFNQYKENTYVLENAHKFGFIVRYPVGKEHITGYKSEPWHLRYVGVDVAQKIHELNITFDEYVAMFGN